MPATVTVNATPNPVNASKAQISQFAESMAQRLGHDPEKKDIFAVLEALGAKVEYTDAFAATDASLLVERQGTLIVRLSGLCGPDRNRFSAAHELGHYLMHYVAAKRTGVMEAARSGDSSDRAEWEANWFAGAFLMPRSAFTEVHSCYDGNVDLIAAHFQVSRRAAEVRAEVLGLVIK